MKAMENELLKLYNDLKWIIGFLGGWAIITVALATWIGQRIAERLNLAWKEKQNIRFESFKEKQNNRFESLKAEIVKGQTILNAAISSYSFERQSTQNRRLLAKRSLVRNQYAPQVK